VSGRFLFARFLRGARVSRVLANVSSRSQTFLDALLANQIPHSERLFRRDAETSTRDACATRSSNLRIRIGNRGGMNSCAAHLFRISIFGFRIFRS